MTPLARHATPCNTMRRRGRGSSAAHCHISWRMERAPIGAPLATQVIANSLRLHAGGAAFGRLAALDGALGILALSASPTRGVGSEGKAKNTLAWERLLLTYASSLTVFVVPGSSEGSLHAASASAAQISIRLAIVLFIIRTVFQWL